MIGKYARGFRHLKRIVGSSKTKRIFILQNGRILDSVGLLCGSSDNSRSQLLIFQNLGGDSDIFRIPSEYRSIAESLLNRYNRYFIVKDKQHLFQLGRKYFVVEDDFDEQYESFQKNNKKLLDQVYGKYCYANDSIAMFLYALIGNAPNLYVWAVTNFFKNNINLYTIEHIIFWGENYKQLIGKLSKGTVTAYNGKDNVNKLINEIVHLRSAKRANDVINSFNTAQKKLLKKIEMNDKNIHILNRFSRLSKPKRHNFIRKMSTIENVDDIMHQMSLLSNIHFEWNRESLLDFIKNSENVNCDIILDENNIVLVKVNTYDTVKLLAKTTNWCISKNKRYWNDYVGFRNNSSQFVMFDFNKPEDHELSIVGFTSLKNSGITNAHSYSNNNLMGGGHSIQRLSSFMVQECSKNIHSIIKENKIPLGKILNFNPSRYEWNFNSFITFLNYCINEEEYTIHYINEEEGKIAFSSNNENLRFIITNENFANNISIGGKREVFVFMDFEYDEDDSNRIKYAFIYNDELKKEQTASYVCDIYGNEIEQTFDDLLELFYLPYDTICRTNNETERFCVAFRNYYVKELRKLITNKEIINEVISNRRSNFFQSSGGALYESIFSFRSFDYINLIYDNGYKLIDFVNQNSIDDIISSLIYEVANNFRSLGRIPTEEDYNNFEGNHFNQRQRLLIGFFKMLDMILKNEKYDGFGKKVAEIFPGIHHYFDLDIYLLRFIINGLTFTRNSNTINYYLRTIASYNNEEFNKIILDKKMSKECGKIFLSYLSSSSHYYNEFNEKYGEKEEEVKKEENQSYFNEMKIDDLIKAFSIYNSSSSV